MTRTLQRDWILLGIIEQSDPESKLPIRVRSRTLEALAKARAAFEKAQSQNVSSSEFKQAMRTFANALRARVVDRDPTLATRTRLVPLPLTVKEKKRLG